MAPRREAQRKPEKAAAVSFAVSFAAFFCRVVLMDRARMSPSLSTAFDFIWVCICADLHPMTQPFLLAEVDPPAFELCHAMGKAPVLLTCDHASHAVPAALAKLGLTDVAITEHIGWDIGAAAVTRRLAPLLDAPAVLAGFSRLVIDCNRDPHDASSIATESDGIAIPGNIGLDGAARQARRSALFEPYHAAIDAQLARMGAHGVAPAVISMHSFTPRMRGFARPWHVGVLWDEDGRIALPLLDALRATLDPALVGDNQPYSAREPVGYTQRYHAWERGLPHVALELRQDLIHDDAGAALWAELLAQVLKPILAAPGLYVAITPPRPHT
jgi:predicted N-formylglutamate amidohydrolase